MSIIYDALQKIQKARQADLLEKAAATAKASPKSDHPPIIAEKRIDADVSSPRFKLRLRLPRISISLPKFPKLTLPKIKLPRINVSSFMSRLPRIKFRISAGWIKATLMSVISVLAMGLVFILVQHMPEQRHVLISSITTPSFKVPFELKTAELKLTDVWNAVVNKMPKRRKIIASQYKADHLLNGVFISKRDSVAMINNRMFHVGDMVDGMMITSIEVGGIKVEHDDQEIYLLSQG